MTVDSLMHPIRPSHAQQGTQATREPPASPAQTIPVTHFKPHFVVGGGDCLFHALRMGSTNQPAVPVSMEHIMSLRQDAANYVAEHRSALMTHPSFGGEAGVNALYGLLITQGQWNENAGDLVPPILARVLGREIRILEPTQHGDSYDANENQTFRPQDTDTGLPPAKPDTEQPPIYLAHINNAHYEYLEPRAPHADTAPESIKARSLSDSIASLSDTSSFDSTSITRWIDKLLDEQSNGLTDEDISLPPPPQDSSFGRVSSLSSLESYSSKGFLESFAAKEKNSPTEVVGQPPKKSPRHAERRREQEHKTMKGATHPLLGNRRVTAKAASHEIMKTQTGKGTKQVRTHKARNEITKALTDVLHNRSFDTLTPVEQVAEIIRISRKTGYSPSGVRTTLTGGGNKPVTTQAARNEIINTFTDAANNRPFDALTKEEQEAEVVRVSRVTGYRPSGVKTTLAGGGNRQVRTQVAITQITEAFTKVNDRPFDALTPEAQDAEVMRISKETGYRQSGVLTTLNGQGNKQVKSQVARNEIINTFTDAANNRPFDALIKEEQEAEVMRVSRVTGYNPSAVRIILAGGGTNQVTSQAAITNITNAFTETNNRPFNALTTQEKTAEVTRISRKTGYKPLGVLTTLTGEGNKRVRTKVARIQITNAFTESNNRPFNALTTQEKTAEVTRISRKTGYKPSGVLTMLIGGGNKSITTPEDKNEITAAFTETNKRPFNAQTSKGNKRVRTEAAESQITNAFTEANNRPFDALTKKEQASEMARISQKTGYNLSGILTTLTGIGTKQVQTQAARAQITNAFTEVNDRPFDTLTKDEQTAEMTRISQETEYNPYAVRATLAGEGNSRVETYAARNEITEAFTEANNRPFDTLTKDEQTAEVMRIARKTGYRSSGVLSTLTGIGTKQVQTQAARARITNAFTEANNRPFNALTKEEQDAEITRISRKTGYRLSGVLTTLTGGGNSRVETQAARAQITNAFTEANNRPFDALTKEEQDAEATRISRKTGYRFSGVLTTLTGGGNKQVRTQAARAQITNAFTEANNRPFDALTKEEQDTEVTRISRETGYNPSGVRTTLNKRASAKPK